AAKRLRHLPRRAHTCRWKTAMLTLTPHICPFRPPGTYIIAQFVKRRGARIRPLWLLIRATRVARFARTGPRERRGKRTSGGSVGAHQPHQRRQREVIAMKTLITLAAALAAGVALSSGAIAQDKPKLAFVVNA